jgi:hypothetical protein
VFGEGKEMAQKAASGARLRGCSVRRASRKTGGRLDARSRIVGLKQARGSRVDPDAWDLSRRARVALR